MGGTFDNRVSAGVVGVVRESSGLLELSVTVVGVRFVHIIGSWRPRLFALLFGVWVGWSSDSSL